MADTGVPMPEDLHVLDYLDVLGEESDEQLATYYIPDEPTNIVGDDPDVTVLDAPEEV